MHQMLPHSQARPRRRRQAGKRHSLRLLACLTGDLLALASLAAAVAAGFGLLLGLLTVTG